jgi:hypothetical protein
MPVGPGLLAADGFRPSPAEAISTDGDGVGKSLLARKDVIELAFTVLMTIDETG